MCEGYVKDVIMYDVRSPSIGMSIKISLTLPQVMDRNPCTAGTGGLPMVGISNALATDLEGVEGDLLYISDKRKWLGGLYSTHAVVGEIFKHSDNLIQLDRETSELVITKNRINEILIVEKLY